MYTAVILSVLVAAVLAGQRPVMMFGKPMPPPPKLNEPEPGRCCAEPSYTYEAGIVQTSITGDGYLLTDLVKSRGAYDSIEKKIGFENDVAISNGTVYTVKTIADFKEGKGYYIYTEEGERKCVKFPITSGFPYNCLPEESKYIGSVTIGDRALTAENWYYNRQEPDKDTHFVFSIKKPECINLSYIAREFDPRTGDEIKTTSVTNFDYSLGICDPDKWFKPPEECETQKVKNVDAVPKKIARQRGPSGQLMFQ